MHKILTAVVISASFLLASCGNTSVKNADTIEGKKAQLTSLKSQQDKLTQQITTLEAEIAKGKTAADESNLTGEATPVGGVKVADKAV